MCVEALLLALSDGVFPLLGSPLLLHLSLQFLLLPLLQSAEPDLLLCPGNFLLLVLPVSLLPVPLLFLLKAFCLLTQKDSVSESF